VFACLGFLEAADVLMGNAEGGFDWSREPTRFRLRAAGADNPFAVAMDFIANVDVRSAAPFGSVNRTEEPWKVPTETLGRDVAFPFFDPSSPATLPTILEGPSGFNGERRQLSIDHYGDETVRDAVKFWGGSGGYPAAALVRDAVDLVRSACRDTTSDPFSLPAEQSSSFRFDWRRDYIPIDAGFSLNSHSGKIVSVGFPLVEVFAALGLTNARPVRLHVLEYRYGVIGAGSNTFEQAGFFEPMFLRAALGGGELLFPGRRFRMCLNWANKKGQARAITTVAEEPIR
jgi:CRISPR-associated protein Csx14